MAKNKVNPRKRPVNMMDVKREIDKSVNDALHLSIAIFLTVLLDYHGFDREQIQTVWKQVDKLSEEVAERRVSVRDLVTVLEEEYGVILE